MSNLTDFGHYYRAKAASEDLSELRSIDAGTSELIWIEIANQQDDLDSFFAEFEGNPEYQEGLIEAGTILSEELYGPDGANLAAIRLRKGLTQADVARLAGIKQPAYARIENCENQDPKLSTIKKLANALEESIETIANAINTGGSDD